MTNKADGLFEVEAPPPFSKFEDIDIPAGGTRQLQLARGDVRQLLPKDLLKKHQQTLKKLKALFVEYGIDDLLDEYAKLRAELQEYRSQFYAFKRAVQESGKPATAEDKQQLKLIKANSQSVRDDLKALDEKLAPYRKYIHLSKRLESRIAGHEAALLDEQINDENRRLMDLEANTVLDAIRSTLNGMNYCFRTSESRNGKVRQRVVSIGFSRVVVTPDTIQIRLKTGRRGLFGGWVDEIPQGVNIWDALRNSNTLPQISSAIEMPVSCPQLETGNYHEGPWLLIQRNGLLYGLPKHVRYSDYIKRYPNEQLDKLPIPSGLREGLWVGWEYLAERPHLLVSGETGSGKTNLMLSIISTLISRHSPEEIQFIFCDLKEGVDFHMFKDIPHAIEFIEDVPRLAQVISAIEELRADRMHELKASGMRNINDFNRKHPEYRMPHIALVIDEFGALTSGLYSKEAKHIYNICDQLAQKARAAGIHMILGTQTPNKQNIPTAIRDNVKLKLAGTTSNVHASIAAIGVGDAAKLPQIPGRFLCKAGVQLYQVQMPEILDDEVNEAIRIANSYGRVESPIKLLPEGEPVVMDSKIKKLFNTSEFVRITLEEFGGIINYTSLHQHVQGDYDVSRKQLKTIAEQIKASGKVTYDGTQYDVVTTGAGRSGYKLIAQSQDDDLLLRGQNAGD